MSPKATGGRRGAAGARRLSGWHRGAGCARAVDRPRRLAKGAKVWGADRQASARPRPGDRTRSACVLAPLFARRWTPDASAAPRPRRRALWVIPPDDVAIVICGGDLDKAVPEFGAADVLLGLIAADVALEHHVAVV